MRLLLEDLAKQSRSEFDRPRCRQTHRFRATGFAASPQNATTGRRRGSSRALPTLNVAVFSKRPDDPVAVVVVGDPRRRLGRDRRLEWRANAVTVAIVLAAYRQPPAVVIAIDAQAVDDRLTVDDPVREWPAVDAVDGNFGQPPR